MEIERYAELRAEMDTGALRDDVLARAGLSVDEWVGVQRDWLEKMGDELSRGRRELTNQYTKAFLERQRALAGAKERSPAPQVETTPPQAPSPQAALPQAPMPLLPPLPPLPQAPMPPAPLPPPKVPPLPPMAAPSIETAPLPPVVVPPVLVQTPLSSPAMNATSASVVSPFAAASALPFAPEAGSLPAPKPPPPKQPLSNELTGTVAATMMSPFASALPFAKAPPPPPSRPDSVSSTSMPVPPPSRPDSVSSTSMPVPPPSRPDSVSSTSMPIPPPSRPDSVSSTSMPVPPLPVAKPPPPKPAPPPLPPKAPPPPPLAAAPPSAPSAAPLPSLTVEQHASLCAELAFTPARADEILGRYRVTPEGKARFDQVMRERFAENPTLQSRWQEAYQVYYAFLRGATAKQRPKDG